MPFIKKAKSSLEPKLQSLCAENYGFSPKILSVDKTDLPTVTMEMEKVHGHSLYELYGDDPSKVPAWIWERIRHMLVVLYEREGIQYIDITPFNFMLEKEVAVAEAEEGSEEKKEDKAVDRESSDRLWIIDFGDAFYTEDEPLNWFLERVLDGEESWNPDFA